MRCQRRWAADDALRDSGRVRSGFRFGCFGASFRGPSRAATELASGALQLACLAPKLFYTCLKLFTNLLLAHVSLSTQDEGTILVRSLDDALGSISIGQPGYFWSTSSAALQAFVRRGDRRYGSVCSPGCSANACSHECALRRCLSSEPWGFSTKRAPEGAVAHAVAAQPKAQATFTGSARSSSKRGSRVIAQ
jgi:hypothetical protein